LKPPSRSRSGAGRRADLGPAAGAGSPGRRSTPLSSSGCASRPRPRFGRCGRRASRPDRQRSAWSGRRARPRAPAPPPRHGLGTLRAPPPPPGSNAATRDQAPATCADGDSPQRELPVCRTSHSAAVAAGRGAPGPPGPRRRSPRPTRSRLRFPADAPILWSSARRLLHEPVPNGHRSGSYSERRAPQLGQAVILPTQGAGDPETLG